MTEEVIIIGFSNQTPDGVVLHTNIPARLKTGNVLGKEFWVSWDKIGAALLHKYTEKTLVDELNALREQYSPSEQTTPITGVSLIAMERSEQIAKHHHSVESDRQWNPDGQLSFAAALLTAPNPWVFAREGNNYSCPDGWDKTLWLKMLGKSYKQRLIIAGALIAAELDRIQASEP